ncbi:MAG TPA: CsbD family protein [Sphingobium sp.]|uniref:CsbD family protein n=1 Tax=Sphingobium sp. TaxID=1912891 RepID=UPI002ECFFAFA
MGEPFDKARGAVNQTIGKGEEVRDRKADDGMLVAEGKVQQVKGSAQKLKGAVKGALGNIV